MSNVLSIILGGGKGQRLYPLTKERAKPAVPFGAKYRLVDVPISNSINSGFKRMYVLTQFNSASLHIHIASTYIFDGFSRGFVEILAAEPGFDHSGWYVGTADAVRKNFMHFRPQEPSHYIILSGDQLYRMDIADMFHTHVESGARITVAATPVDREAATAFGVLQADRKGRVTSFKEKPPLAEDISHMRIPGDLRNEQSGSSKDFLGSMGIYVFNADALEQALDNDMTDFGHEILPAEIDNGGVHAYLFDGFWEDIGTIRSFYETNLNLASINPDFNFYDEKMPIYTHKRDLPASKFNSCTMKESLAGDGCVLTNATVSNSLIGIRTYVENGSELEGVVCMGADYYETVQHKQHNRELHRPDIAIGPNSRIRNAIIDKNARIGAGASIGYARDTYSDGDYDRYYVRDGIILIPKNAVIPEGYVI
ncbi:MAG: glucose-1-phosphate adenylyltransferase [Spirochaetota bacterium]